MGESYGRNDRHAEHLRGSNPSVPGDDLALIIDQHRIAEAKALDAFGNLADLLLGVGTRIVRIRPERFNRKHLDREGGIDPNALSIAGAVTTGISVLRGTRRGIVLKVAHWRPFPV